MPKYEYKPKAGAVEEPRHLYINPEGAKRVAVAIGGPVTIQKTPPKRPIVFPEATPEQLEFMYEVMGLTDLIERVEVETKTKRSRRSKKDEEADEDGE